MSRESCMKILDEATSKVSVLYKDMDASFLIKLNEATSDARGYAARRPRFVSGIMGLTTSFFSNSLAIIKEAQRNIEIEAREDAGSFVSGVDTQEELDQHLTTLRERLTYNINSVTRRLVFDYVLLLDRHILEVGMVARAHNMPLTSAAAYIQTRKSFKAVERVQNDFGHNVKVAYQIHQLTRHFLLTAYNDTLLFELATMGELKAEVKSPDGHKFYNMRFSIYDDEESYDDVRSTVFHPNSNCVAGRIYDVST